MKISTTERFYRHVEPEPMSGCFLWTGCVTRPTNGYGMFYFNGKMQPAHRVAFELAYGGIPTNLNVLHSCDNPPCVALAHLHLGTDSENAREAVMRGRHPFASRTRCKRGHAFDTANTYIHRRRDGSVIQRECRKCRRIKQQNVVSIRSAVVS